MVYEVRVFVALFYASKDGENPQSGGGFFEREISEFS